MFIDNKMILSANITIYYRHFLPKLESFLLFNN